MLALQFKFGLNPRLPPWALQYAKKQSEKIIMDIRTEGGIFPDSAYNCELALNSTLLGGPCYKQKKCVKVIVMNKTEMKLLFFLQK